MSARTAWEGNKGIGGLTEGWREGIRATSLRRTKRLGKLRGNKVVPISHRTRTLTQNWSLILCERASADSELGVVLFTGQNSTMRLGQQLRAAWYSTAMFALWSRSMFSMLRATSAGLSVCRSALDCARSAIHGSCLAYVPLVILVATGIYSAVPLMVGLG